MIGQEIAGCCRIFGTVMSEFVPWAGLITASDGHTRTRLSRPTRLALTPLVQSLERRPKGGGGGFTSFLKF